MGRQNRFTAEEKKTAVKLVEETGRSPTSVANEYGVHPNTIWKWQQIYRTNPGEAFGQGDNAGPGETKRMKRRIAELEAEVAFLKKATAYFARGSQRSTPSSASTRAK